MNPLNLYHVFYTVAQCGNISNAAKQLYISQPAVSKAISRLEENFSSPLLNRTSKGVTLTDNGEILYKQLETAFQSIKKGEEIIKKNDLFGVGKLSIGVSTTLCKYVLLPYLQTFIHNNPNIKVSISCQSSFETIAGLENGTIDIGLVGETDRLYNYHFIPLRTIHDIFVAQKDYLVNLEHRVNLLNSDLNSDLFTEKFIEKSTEKLIEQSIGKSQFNSVKKSENNLSDKFSHSTMLLLNKNNITRQYIDKYILLNNIQFEQQIEVTTMELLIDFAKIGLGIACVIGEFVENEIKEGLLTEFKMQESIPPRQIGIAYSKTLTPSIAMQKFINLVTNTI